MLFYKTNSCFDTLSPAHLSPHLVSSTYSLYAWWPWPSLDVLADVHDLDVALDAGLVDEELDLELQIASCSRFCGPSPTENTEQTQRNQIAARELESAVYTKNRRFTR